MSRKGESGFRISEDYSKIFHKLRQQGRTYKEIAERFGVGQTTVSSCIKRYIEQGDLVDRN